MPRETERITARHREYCLVPLLFLLLFGGTVAAPTPESLYRKARAAAEKGHTKAVLAITLEAQKQFGDSDNEWVWWLRCFRGRALVNDGKADDAVTLLQRPFPARFRNTELDVWRLESQAWAATRSKNPELAEPLIVQAYTLAKEKHPKKVASSLLIRMLIDRKNAMKWGTEALRFLRMYPDATTEMHVRRQTAMQYARSGRFD